MSLRERLVGSAAGILALMLLVSATALAQNATETTPAPPPIHIARNAIYAELGGNGLIGSLNYERIIGERIGLMLGGGVYITQTGEYPNTESVTIPLVPIMAHYFFGTTHMLELGVGVCLQLKSTACEYYLPPVSCTFLKPTLLIGYRLQPREGGFVLRAGFTPVFYGDGVYPGAGVSIGAAF